MEALVTVIVPIYNVEKFLPKCMESLLGQTYKNLEIILINDGSTDGCQALCEAYAKEDQRILLIKKENGGLSSARNAGLCAAHGVYIYFLDPDDSVDLDLIKKTVWWIEKEQADMCVFCMRHTYGDQEERIPDMDKEYRYSWKGEEQQFHFLASAFFSYKIAWGVCGRLFKREIIERHGLRFVSEREIFAEDLLFTYMYLLHGQSVICIPDCLYHYITREDSLIHLAKSEETAGKYTRLMHYGKHYTRKCKKHYIANHFSVFYTILLGNHVKNLWLHQRKFKLRQIRNQFLLSDEQDFMKQQLKESIREKRLIFDQVGSLHGKILVSIMKFIQKGNKIKFYAEILPCGCSLFFKRCVKKLT